MAYPDGKGYPFIVEAGTEEYDALLALLEQYSWHEQINTLGGDGTINGTGRGTGRSTARAGAIRR